MLISTNLGTCVLVSLAAIIIGVEAKADQANTCRPRRCGSNPNVAKRPKRPTPPEHCNVASSFSTLDRPDNAALFPPPEQPSFSLDCFESTRHCLQRPRVRVHRNDTCGCETLSSKDTCPDSNRRHHRHSRSRHHHERNRRDSARQVRSNRVQRNRSYAPESHHSQAERYQRIPANAQVHRNNINNNNNNNSRHHNHAEHYSHHHNHHYCHNSTTTQNSTDCSHGGSHHEHISLCHDCSFEEVRMRPDVGFYKFYYGKTGSYSWQNFVFTLKEAALFTLVDCYCPGDHFVIMDDGKMVQNIDYCEEPTCECRHPLSNPRDCLFAPEGEYCTGGVMLLPGRHNVTIGVSRALFPVGSAFVRLDTLCYDEFGYAYLCCLDHQNCPMGIWAQ